MSKLHQMQVSYVPEQDRILFRINTDTRQEFRFWMTRRYVVILWKAVANLVQSSVPQANTVSPAAVVDSQHLRDELLKSAEVKARHKKLVENSDFQTRYQESQYLPLGEAPTLLYGVAIKPGTGSQPLLCLSPQKGEGIELALNEKIAHSLCKLLADAAAKADWKLDLTLVSPGIRQFPEGMN